MPNVNPGPAVNGIANSINVVTPTNSGPTYNATYQGSNALRLLASLRGVSVGSAGDTAVAVINTSSFQVTTVLSTNSKVSGVSGSVATATVGLYTAPAQGGSAIVTTAALTSQAASTYVKSLTVALANTSLQTTYLYMNVGTAVANGTIDLFIYGYDLS